MLKFANENEWASDFITHRFCRVDGGFLEFTHIDVAVRSGDFADLGTSFGPVQSSIAVSASRDFLGGAVELKRELSALLVSASIVLVFTLPFKLTLIGRLNSPLLDNLKLISFCCELSV